MSNSKRTLINEALRLIRLYWGFSQSELAEKLQLSQSMISDIERGSKNVTVDVLERYSEKLGIRMSQLMFFAEELEAHPAQTRGKLIIADHALKLLQTFAPNDTQKEIENSQA